MENTSPSRILAINREASNESGARSNFLYGNLLEQKRYIFVLDHIKNLDVLDCAAGIGWGSFLMARSGAKKVVGVELSENAISAARKYYACENVEFINSAIEDANVREDSFDVVVSFETVEHVSRPVDFLRKLRSVSKPSATLFLSTPNGYAFKATGRAPCNPYHEEEYSRADLEGMFAESGWAVTEYRGQYPMKRDSEEVGNYRDFIRDYWRHQELSRRFGLPYRMVAFAIRKITGSQLWEPAFNGDCNPVIIEKGYEPAYHYFILRAV